MAKQIHSERGYILRIVRVGLFVVLAAIGTAGVTAAQAQTSVAANFYGTLNSSATGNGVIESATNSTGILVQGRHIFNPLLGVEGTYSFNTGNEQFSTGPTGTQASVPVHFHTITVDWVPSIKLGSLRPFGMLGAGVVIEQPGQSSVVTVPNCGPGTCPDVLGSTTTTSSTEPAIVYGAGADWGFLPHFGLRIQFRDVMHKAATMTALYGSAGTYQNTVEPSFGFYFNF